MLVDLIDELLSITTKQDYRFMLDGQTVVLEDYLEIRPEKRDLLLATIRAGKIVVGPWYLLPDEWLVGAESLIRNLEYSHDLAQTLDVPLMDVAYLPDQFGHTSTLPQLIGDLTSLRAVVLWRGVPPEIMTVPFIWRSHNNSQVAISGVYMPGGYGNASRFPDEYDEFVEAVKERVDELRPFSPVPVYLLMNGSDHLFPQSFVHDFVERLATEGTDISLGVVSEYVSALEHAIKEAGYTPPTYVGEFRSPARAPLLPNTYSARMWIKLWNQKVEDMLCMTAEPIWSYIWFHLQEEYPTRFLTTAWRWLLRNHPHDSICGCSIDRTHEEMTTRFSWAETIIEGVLERARKRILAEGRDANETTILVFNPTNVTGHSIYVEFTVPEDEDVRGVEDTDGRIYQVQQLRSEKDEYLDMTVGMRMARMGMRLLTGRKLMGFYINGVELSDGDEPGLLELRFIADDHPDGEFNMDEFKRHAREIFASGRYKKIHLVAARPTQAKYATCVKLPAFAFSKLTPVSEERSHSVDEFLVDERRVSNKFYEVRFNKDGSLTLINRESGQKYEKLHVFEDVGDRGDEYTFGHVGPQKARVNSVKRTVVNHGPVMAEIKQEMSLEVFGGLDETRERRVGHAKIMVESRFRFYSDSRRIDITTRLTNTAKDHRLRICFDLPFHAKTTQTATHFGFIERSGEPESIPDDTELERTGSSYPELPTGVQPQKGFIRVEDKRGTEAITVYNKGIPEVELVDGRRIAITLIRAVGWLSRSDFPERPVHAGPDEATPGAQELNREYVFKYGIAVHSKDVPMHDTADYAEMVAESAVSFTFVHANPRLELTEPIVQPDNRAIRISSLRVRDNAILVTLFNLTHKRQRTTLQFARGVTAIERVLIDGTVVKEHRTVNHAVQLEFAPREIMMLRLQRGK